MTDRPCAEYRMGENGRGARKRMRRGVSNGFGLAGRVLLQRFFGEGIELASLNVLLQLAIPRRPVERQKPVPKLCKFLSGKSLDLVLDSFNLAHDTSLALPPKRRLTHSVPADPERQSVVAHVRKPLNDAGENPPARTAALVVRGHRQLNDGEVRAPRSRREGLRKDTRQVAAAAAPFL